MLPGVRRSLRCMRWNNWPVRLAWTVALLLGQLGFWIGAVDADPGQDSFTILLSNDDGIEAEGLKILHDALQPLATIVVVAPAINRSGSGHSVTIDERITVEPRRRSNGTTWYAVHATPATTVRLGLKALLDEKPDLVISGINHGRNVGVLTWTSGTVGAAREAALWGVPAIAVSQSGADPDDYQALARYVVQLVSLLQANNLIKAGLLLNVNGPSGLASKAKGIRVVPLGNEQQSSFFKRLSPEEGVVFREIWHPPKPEGKEGDVSAHALGYITVTPLALDQTDQASLDALAVALNAEADSESLQP